MRKYTVRTVRFRTICVSNALTGGSSLLLLNYCPAFAADCTALVVGVIDGVTIEVLHKDHAERIRLIGIDCPEKGQAYGTRA